MVLVEGFPQVDNNPNLNSSKLSFYEYRDLIDNQVANLHEGNHVMPRTGIFIEDDYNAVLNHDKTIFDDNGTPLVASHTVAYPNANLEKYHELSRSGYLMVPIEGLTNEQLAKIHASDFDNIIAEITFGKVIDYSKDWDICTAELDRIYEDIAQCIVSVTPSIKGFSEVKPFDGDGRPVIHHQFELTHWSHDLYRHDTHIIDTVESRQKIAEKVSDLTSHHIDAFSEHSKSATLITLDHADEIEEMFGDPNWYVAAYLDEEDQIVASVIATNSIGETPWIDPSSINPEAFLVNVDSVSTAESARRKGFALTLLIDSLHRQYEQAEAQGKDSIIVPFDTAGNSTESVSKLAHAVFEAAGAKITRGHVDVIAHLQLKK